jgi:hypothetical protein
VIRSTNDGIGWEDVSSGLPRNSVTFSLAVNCKDRIFASSDVVYRTRRTTTSVEDGRRETPADFSLEQNYPNPFNPTTTIKFSVESANGRTGDPARVTLKVYDILGREVRTLVNEDLQPGSYEATFDAAGLASGMYFYRLQAGDPSAGSGRGFVQTKKLLLLR